MSPRTRLIPPARPSSPVVPSPLGRRRLFLTLVAFGVVALLAACAERAAEAPAPAPPPNVVFLVGDGFGAGAWGLAREWARVHGEELALDLPSDVGFLEVSAVGSLVTDSGAASTAWSLERLGERGRIGPADDEEVVHLLQRLHEAGRSSGIVTTSRITHATPSGFYGQVDERSRETELAGQLVESMAAGFPVLALGGGRSNFRPRTAGGRRKDDRDLIAEAEKAGIRVIGELTGALPDSASILGLFADSNMPHEVDRDESVPDLAELALAALARLEATGRPWFLLVEEGRIDSAAHDYDGPSIARNVRRLDRALKAILETVDLGRTLVVVGADHATASPVWMEWARPESLAVVTTSVERMEAEIFGGQPWRGTPGALEEKALPILDAGARQTGLSAADLDLLVTFPKRYERRAVIGRAISRRFGIAFLAIEDRNASEVVHGHTGEPVPVRAWGPRAAEVAGVRNHGELGRWLAEVMELPPAAPLAPADSAAIPPAGPDSVSGIEPIDTAGGHR